MSEQMREFLTEWLAWALADAPVHPAFVAHKGLCGNLYQWSCYDNDLSDELEELLNGVVYPFGESDYNLDRKFQTQHHNAKRLAWVLEQLA